MKTSIFRNALLSLEQDKWLKIEYLVVVYKYMLFTFLNIYFQLRTAYKMQPKIGIGIIFKLWDDKEENNR